QRLDYAEGHQRRWVPLIAAPRALAVALEERIVGLGARAVRAADPVARGTGDGFRAPEESLMHPTKRSGGSAGRATAPESVRKVVLVLEEQLPAIGQLRQTDVAGRDALRVERGMHLAEKRAGRRGLAKTQLVSALGQAKRLARRLQAEGRGPGERGGAGSPARTVV